MAKKQYTFHIDSTATIQAENREEAKQELKQIINQWRGVSGEDKTIGDDIVIGSQVGEVVQEEEL